MKTGYFLLLFYLFTSSYCLAQSQVSVYYPSAQSKLAKTEQLQLQQLVASVAPVNIKSIHITGHTDPVGSEDYNLGLSRKRAENVATFLKTVGIGPQQLRVTYLGEDGANPNDKSKWRRVDVRLETKAYKPAAELYQKVSKTQEHYIRPDRDTLLRCEQGTVIHIKAGTFELTKGKEPVRFEVKEVFKKSDMILENLTTTSNGKILETRGMIYTQALQGTDTLKLLKDITIMMPTENYTPAAGVFDGSRDPHSDAMNWAVSNNSVLRNFSVSDFRDCEQYAKHLQALNELGIKPDGKPGGTALRDLCEMGLDTLKEWISPCAILDKPRCPLFFCQMKRLGTGIGGSVASLFSSRRRANRRATRQRLKEQAQSDKKLDETLERLRDKKEPLTVEDVKELQKTLKEKKRRNGKVALSKDEERMLALSNAISSADSLIASDTYDLKTQNNCYELDSLFQTYGVTDVQELTRVINQPLLDEFGVKTMAELLPALKNANFESLEAAYAAKNISYNDFKFYVFNASTLGWKNLDIFANIPASQQVDVRVDIVPGLEVDCKLVFKDRAFVLPGKIGDGFFYFEGVPKGEKAWIVALKYENATPYLALMPIEVAKKSFSPSFEEKSLEELKVALEILDFQN